MRVSVRGGLVEVDSGWGNLPVAITAEEATELAKDLHIAACAIRLDRTAKKRYDMEKKAIENVLSRRGK